MTQGLADPDKLVGVSLPAILLYSIDIPGCSSE